MADQRRTYKVAEKIRAIVADELLHTADARFSLVTVTSVVVNNDLKLAKIYWVVSGSRDRVQEVEDGFQSATGFFRRALGEKLGLKFVPALRFYYDDTLDTVEEVDRLLEQARQRSH